MKLVRFFILQLLKFLNYLFLKASLLKKENYQIVVPYATYAPWIKDSEFLKVFQVVKKISLVNIYQCWELWKLTEETDKIAGDVIEIGVWKGASSAIIAYKLQLLNSKSKLYCCDTFEGVVKASNKDNFYQGGEHKDTSQQYVENLLSNKLMLENFVILKGIFPEETGNHVKYNVFRLCHIDVDVYDSARDIVDWIWERMSIGGVIVFNDFGYPRTQGITKFVEDNRFKKDRIVIHNLNGNGIIIKVSFEDDGKTSA